MDTRPYRLSWPTSTMIFDVSPEKVFEIASNKLQGLCFPLLLFVSKLCLGLVMYHGSILFSLLIQVWELGSLKVAYSFTFPWNLET